MLVERRWLIGLIFLVGSCTATSDDPVMGVSKNLADGRAAGIGDVRYDLHFAIPEALSDPITGTVQLSFRVDSLTGPLVLDFRGQPGDVHAVTVDGAPSAFRTPDGHIVLPEEAVSTGDHVISVAFQSSNDALNRHEDFLYTLFVPDRASTAFPSFDQPNLKARYRLSLEVPQGWIAVANGSVESEETTVSGRTSLSFRETPPLSTYLFAFAAGKLKVETAERAGRTLVMYHRETDSDEVVRNRDAIFDLHATALEWLERYTGIPYPFEKFSFFAVPSFQFGGMEHPGAVWYRAGSLFLDESATQNQYLGRASVIAHETAHMWFGDLVTMEWFDDVWMKEVFANFMAAKIVEPSFPNIDHRLRFFLAHHPTAYGVDRTLGANPIRQPLENLREAGSLYGAIIYQKAPIVMRQLELLIGEQTMQAGLKLYLDRHRFANASWNDLVTILDSLTPIDVRAWSQAWVEEPWRPQLSVERGDRSLFVRQADPRPGRDLVWPQAMTVAVETGDSVLLVEAQIDHPVDTVLVPTSFAGFVLPGVDGVSYGRIGLDSLSQVRLLERAGALPTPLHRATTWSALWEGVLAGEIPPSRFLDATLDALPSESDQLIVQQLLGLIQGTFWRFHGSADRAAVAPRLEAALWRALDQARNPSSKGALFASLVSITTTDSGVARLEQIWERQTPPEGLPLSEQQYTSLAEALALRMTDRADSILDRQASRITNPDRKARFTFVRRALATDRATRDSAFESFRDLEQRRRESWVLSALGYLNHPLRAPGSERYLEPGLTLLEEIQRTGDIFFPLRWLNALLDGHQSATAAESVVRYLDAHPDLPPRLAGKLLQAADDLFRSAMIVDGWDDGPTLESGTGR